MATYKFTTVQQNYLLSFYSSLEFQTSFFSKKLNLKNMLNRYRGCFVGLAIGDALGAPLEFLKRDSYEPLTHYQEGGVHAMSKGEYTDDTSMALCLAQSLLEKRGFDAYDQLQKYVQWLYSGYMSTRKEMFDVGITIEESLEYFLKTGETKTYLRDEKYSGNGALMRLAPVVLFYAQDIKKAIFFAKESALTTHASILVSDSCRYFAYILVLLLYGVQKSELFGIKGIKQMEKFFQAQPLHPKVQAVADGSFIHKQRDQIKSSGYVIDTLEASLWAFYKGKNFKESLLLAVNLGDDADSIGAVTGQLCGAFYGFSNIDKKLFLELYNHNFIDLIAKKLYRFKIK